ncbi:hypothetical protein DM860_008237 [Cuscuta australis]|uniref:Uncharacterized protein n=1 Tax=Cuscuta australis TaxID=267555 RepID=A0A328D2R7_9ASTE|nr:hypothetical protein DM860_008237 [Cuscuta australis]
MNLLKLNQNPTAAPLEPRVNTACAAAPLSADTAAELAGGPCSSFQTPCLLPQVYHATPLLRPSRRANAGCGKKERTRKKAGDERGRKLKMCEDEATNGAEGDGQR